MINAEIHGKVYQVCSEWGDITLGKFIELAEISIPEKLERSWIASAGLNVDGKKEKKAALKESEAANNAFTEADLVKFFPAYYGKVLTVLSEVPKKVVTNIHSDLRASFFEDWHKGFALSLIYSSPVTIAGKGVKLYHPEEIADFELEGETYHFPGSLKLYDELIPMANETVISFAEAADIDLAILDLRSQGVKRFPILMGIYCRKKGETYDEQMALKRAEWFKSAKMDTVWSLFFCIVRLMHISQNSIRMRLLNQVAQIGKATIEAVG